MNQVDLDKSVTEATEGGKGTVNLIYILYLASMLLGITGLIGVVMAYVNRGGAPAWLQSHYTFQIRTFWYSFVLALAGVLTAIFMIGYLILLFMLVWYIVRCVKGMKALGANQPIANPTGWGFGG